MKIGDKVRVSNVNLETFGRIGLVTGYGNVVGHIRVDVDGLVQTYHERNLQAVDNPKTKEMKKKDDYHVAIWSTLDDSVDFDFTNNPSIRTIEEEFGISCETTYIGTIEDIKREIMEVLERWDNVVGLIDNKPFKASRSIVFEGVDL